MKNIQIPSLLATLSLLLIASPLILSAEESDTDSGRITLERIFSRDSADAIHPTKDMPRVLGWQDADHYLVLGDDREKPEVISVDAKKGKRQTVWTPKSMSQALAKLTGLDQTAAASLASPYAFDRYEKNTAVVLNHANDLFFYRQGGSAVRLTMDPDSEVGEDLSPDGRTVAFVRNNDLHLVDVATLRERQLTQGGDSEHFNGRLDWVYQEEIYGRGNFKGFWWSPDSQKIAFLRLDESKVREFTVVDHIPNRGLSEITNYPKAGDANPTVQLGVISVAGGPITWVDLAPYTSVEPLIVRVGWTPDSSHVAYQVQNREQTWLDLNLANPRSGNSTTILKETTPAWVEVNGEPRWLKDGSFLWLSEKTGYKHIYHYEADGKIRREITQGDWEVRRVYGLDSSESTLYFGGMKDDPIAEQVYSISLNGGEIQRLSDLPGSHRAQFNPDRTRWIDTWSSFGNPPKMLLHTVGSKESQIIWEPSPVLENLNLGSIERHQVPTRDGFVMEAFLIKPPNFDPTKKYPVLQFTYGGPHAPVVQDSYGRAQGYLWHQMLAQEGYLIWMCDNRSASGKGMKPTWEVYQRLGVLELQDIEDGLDWLVGQGFVDPERIGIWGWSYGGFMTAFALTHSERFKMGIAGAPVTDWHLYDSVYTERYMRRPQNNPEGYAETSVTLAAENLSGRLLLLHGTIDDNVHFQNSVQFIYALERAGHDFDLMIYPKSRHGVRDPKLNLHLYNRMSDFVRENL